MTKQEYLQELNKAFGDFKFFEEDHHYEYKDQRIGVSVTRFIEQYANEFDADTIAQKVAIKEGKSVQEVLDEWQIKNEWACFKGSLSHQYVQEKFESDCNQMFYPDDEVKRDALNKIYHQADCFYEDYKDRLELLANEKIIGSEVYDIASAVDSLFINKLTGGLVLVDYKTNSNIHKNERYAKDMKAPLSHLKDTTLSHYFIQVSIYKYLIEKYTDLEVDEWFIVWFSENNEEYQVIDVPYLKEEVEKILEWRKWE